MRTCSRTPNAPINAKAVVSGCWLGPVGSEWRKRGGPPPNPTATVRQEFTRAPPASPLGGGAALGAEHRGGEGRWGRGRRGAAAKRISAGRGAAAAESGFTSGVPAVEGASAQTKDAGEPLTGSIPGARPPPSPPTSTQML